MTDIPVSSLSHHGVKGQKWGVTKKRKLSRKEVRAEKDAYYQKKASSLVNQALKDPQLLIALNTGGAYGTVVTGRQFVEHLTAGGLLNVKYTDVYARQTSKNGPYELNANKYEPFKRSDKQ